MTKYENEVLTFDILERRELDCKALFEGKEVRVDPYVGCVWDEDYFREGKVTFEGFWSREDLFLPGKEIK